VKQEATEVPNRYRLNPRPSGRGARQPVVVGSSPTVLNRERSSIGRAPAAGGFSQAYLKKLRDLVRWWWLLRMAERLWVRVPSP